MNRMLGPLLRFDQKSFFYVFNLADQFNITAPAKSFSRLGDGYLYAIIALTIYLVDVENGELFVTCGLLAFAIELPLYLFLKHTIRRPRPTPSIDGLKKRHQASDEFSLPSGHTAAAFLFATVLSWFYPSFFMLFFSVAGLIGLSRVLLGVHYPSDIAAGILLGCSAAFIALPF